MNLEKIFSTQEAKNEAIEHFRGLKDNMDWIFLVEKMIKADIEQITEELLDPTKTWKDGEEKENKRIRAYWIILSELPEKLIEALKENKSDIFIDSDPYFHNVEEIENNKKSKKR